MGGGQRPGHAQLRAVERLGQAGGRRAVAATARPTSRKSSSRGGGAGSGTAASVVRTGAMTSAPALRASARCSATRRAVGVPLERAGQQVALAVAAPEVAQPGQLGLGLDALGHHHGDVERVGHLHDGPGQPVALGGAVELGHEGLVDLDDVDGEALEVGQRAVAGAEVVDGDADAEVAQVGRAMRRWRRCRPSRAVSVISRVSCDGGSRASSRASATVARTGGGRRTGRRRHVDPDRPPR